MCIHNHDGYCLNFGCMCYEPDSRCACYEDDLNDISEHPTTETPPINKGRD